MIQASPEPICFYKVKALSGIAGNECADAIAKHSALHDGGHDMHFQPPAPDGNAYTHLYWLAAKDTDEISAEKGQLHLGFVHSLIKRPSWKQKCANHTDWGVPKQTQGITTRAVAVRCTVIRYGTVRTVYHIFDKIGTVYTVRYDTVYGTVHFFAG